jgi:V8-like Glu-specific endopeptidase
MPIDRSALYHTYQLRLAIAASAAVVHVRIPGRSLGTGFMIGPTLMMTNQHVLRTPEDATRAVYSFGYELLPDGSEATPKAAGRREGGLFVNFQSADANLDYAVVELDRLPDFGPPLKISTQVPKTDDAVTVIGHPNGQLKRVSLRNNAVHYADLRVIQYTTSTEPGSSGSPVLENSTFAVVALHSRGGHIEEPVSRRRVFRNQGCAMGAVLEDLKARSPELYGAWERQADGR